MPEWSRSRPDSQPEIIPPGAASEFRTRIWVAESGQTFGYRRIGLSPPGPLALLLAGMALGAGALIALVVLLGAVLLWLPLIGLIAVAAVVAGLLRGPSRRRY